MSSTEIWEENVVIIRIDILKSSVFKKDEI